MRLDECFDARVAIGWGLVHFFLWVSGRYWHDLDFAERSEVWTTIARQTYVEG